MSSSLTGAWRGPGPGRPELPLPPDKLPLLRGGRPLKRWRYLGAFGEDVMLCAATARIGVVPLSWWAVWDRGQRTLAEHTARGRPVVKFGDAGTIRVDDGPVTMSLTVESPGPEAAVETVSPHGAEHIWTRKTGGVRVTGLVTLAERRHELDAFGIVDESAGYHARETEWCWSAGVGIAADGRHVAWNLVAGIHDAAEASERSVWVEGVPHEVAPVAFAADLSSIEFADGGELRFSAESTRAREESLLFFASSYEQPFGTFAGSLPGVGDLREAYGVMERHDVKW